MPNRLAEETSLYLRSHGHNPVDWYPWGPEALARAKAENKPILLSVGYSACHWCHVMERESFENADTARLMNEHYINIKVDREERPDLDQIYQNVAQLLTRGGGWPLTVFLTPHLEPFYGGTYFPPADRWGRPGFPRVLAALAEAYKTEPESIQDNARKLLEGMRSLEGVPESEGTPNWADLEESARRVLDDIDWQHGGFGGAPKFPNPMALTFLWRMRSRLPRLRDAVTLSLRKMAEGGIYDQLGGGFHRYSVDERWAVPHFEKMLYDNALLMRLYSEALLSSDLTAQDRALFSETLSSTADYLWREMAAPEGAFYSTQDADTEGEEGKFFVWGLSEVGDVLSGQELEVLVRRLGVTAEGNFSEHAHDGTSGGKTVLYRARYFKEIADELGVSEAQSRGFYAEAARKLFEARKKRVAPARDEKLLTSWNGWALSGFCWASRAFDAGGDVERARRSLETAKGIFEFLKSRCVTDPVSGRLAATVQAGQPKHVGHLDDYAAAIAGALDWARLSPDPESVDEAWAWATRWGRQVVERFKDPAGPGYYFASDEGAEERIVRPKTLFDQATPSGTGQFLGALAALAEGDTDPRWIAELEFQLERLFGHAARNPFGMGELLCSALLALEGPQVAKGHGAMPAWAPGLYRAPGRGPGPDVAPGQWLLCSRGTCSLPLRPDELSARVTRT